MALSLSLNPTAGLLFSIASSIVINRISNALDNARFIYPKNVIESNNPYHYWRFRNFLISFLHASITGIGSLLCVLANPMLVWDVIDTRSEYGYYLTAFSLGYFIYDTLEMSNYLQKKGTAELIIHHFLVMACFLNTVCYTRFIGYNMIALMIELSNIFLHFRQLLLLSNHSKSTRLYQINSVTNIVLFVLVRGMCMFWLWYTLFVNLDRLPSITLIVAFTSMFGITITTSFLFKRLYNSDFVVTNHHRHHHHQHNHHHPNDEKNNDQNVQKQHTFLNGHRKRDSSSDDDFNYEGKGKSYSLSKKDIN